MLPDISFFRKYAQEKNIPWQPRNILLEYLQAQILKCLSSSKYNEAVSFLGGTCLRFAFKIDRFSEDLDFDLVKKTGFDINDLEREIFHRIKLLGFDLDTKVKKTENIYIIYFKFKNVLKEWGLSNLEDEKILIKFEIDYSPYKSIQTDMSLIDSFNERFPLLINTRNTLFAQKIIALKFRPYQKGRDFYDLVWFLAQKDIEPNYTILKEKGINISNRKELAAELKNIISRRNLNQAKKDVERFLFYPDQAKWILDLPKFLDDYLRG